MIGPVLGAVLAGGASSRFGSDKAVALLGDRTLLDHAVATIAPHVDAVVVVGRGEVTDLPLPGFGPLGGIAGALDHGQRSGFASVLTIGCDMVRVPDLLIEALLREAPGYCSDAPVLGHWPVILGNDLIARLASPELSPRPRAGVHRRLHPTSDEGEERWRPGLIRHGGSGGKTGALSVRRWAASVGAVAIPSPVPLANVNTPADLAVL